MSIGEEGNQVLEAHSGDIIRIKFEPKVDKFKDYFIDKKYSIKYSLPKGEVIEEQPEYDYVVEKTLQGLYGIHLSANSSGKEGGRCMGCNR